MFRGYGANKYRRLIYYCCILCIICVLYYRLHLEVGLYVDFYYWIIKSNKLVWHIQSLGSKLAVLVQGADWEELDKVCCSRGFAWLGLFILGFACGFVCDLLTF